MPSQPATLHAIPASKPPAVTAPTTAPQAGQTPGSPAWSPDGRWLAYLVGPPSADGAVTSGALWLAGPDGQGAHQVLPKVAGFAWSPTSDELAATEAGGGRLYAVRPGQPTYPMLEVPGQFDGAPAWSPNGREIAVASVELTASRRFASSVIDLFVPSEGIVVNSLASSTDRRADRRRLVDERRGGAGLVRPGRLGRAARRRAAAGLLPARRRADGDAAEHPGLPRVRGARTGPA